MAAPRSGPCEAWATVADLCSPCDDYASIVGDAEEALDVASDLLFQLSGRQFSGVCSAVVRPCTMRHYEQWSALDPRWVAGCGCRSGYRCGCSSISSISLGAFPIRSITSVKVDGVTLDASRYRIDSYRHLVRLDDADGTNPGWPIGQQLDEASTEDDTFEVAFTYGHEPPASGVRAAAVLACELLLACQPENASRCRLNQRVQSVARQGVTVVLDRLDAFKEGLTGLPEVDLFLTTYNPARLRRRARALSPDVGPSVRRVNT